MSHICIIPGNNRSQAIACYHHLLKRNQFQFVSFIEATDDVFNFFHNNSVSLLMIEDVHASMMFEILQLQSYGQSIDILMITDTLPLNDNFSIYTIAKHKQVPCILDVIDLLAVQRHLARNDLHLESIHSTLQRLYNVIRFVEYSHSYVYFQLKDAELRFSYDTFQRMSFEDLRFLTINPSTIVNINAIRKFDQVSLVLDQGEKIVMSEEYREDCWNAICRYVLPKRHCRLLNVRPFNKKRISLFPLVKE